MQLLTGLHLIHQIQLKIFYELNNKLGVLNVDIDGNDYWILRELLKTIYPEIICVEHNASLGLKSISTPYKKYFDRHEEHKSGFYHGASITAFYKLLNPSYCLVKNIAGLNLIFVRKDKMNKNLLSLTPETCFSESYYRNKFSGTNTKQQWEVIKNLSYENI